jgi:hypothetical protein
MLGDYMLPWFDLFSGVASFPTGTSAENSVQGWVNINDYIRIFENNNAILNGTPYRISDNRKEELTDAIIHHANILCQFGLLEKKRGSYPPRLEYRITKKEGRLTIYARLQLEDFVVSYFSSIELFLNTARDSRKLLQSLRSEWQWLMLSNFLRWLSLGQVISGVL